MGVVSVELSMFSTDRYLESVYEMVSMYFKDGGP